jgi:hypothetical protein
MDIKREYVENKCVNCNNQGRTKERKKGEREKGGREGEVEG